jgi:hypothetical protein
MAKSRTIKVNRDIDKPNSSIPKSFTVNVTVRPAPVEKTFTMSTQTAAAIAFTLIHSLLDGTPDALGNLELRDGELGREHDRHPRDYWERVRKATPQDLAHIALLTKLEKLSK